MLCAAGVGYAVVLIAFYTDFYYNVIISWALYYFIASFNKVLPWSTCSAPWATDACYDNDSPAPSPPPLNHSYSPGGANGTSVTVAAAVAGRSAADDYFRCVS